MNSQALFFFFFSNYSGENLRCSTRKKKSGKVGPQKKKNNSTGWFYIKSNPQTIWFPLSLLFSLSLFFLLENMSRLPNENAFKV